MKKMVADLVNEVKRESRKVIVIEQDVKSDDKADEKKPETEKTEKEKKPRSDEAKKPAKKSAAQNEAPPVITCPKCGKGTMLKGKTAFGCSEYKNGCAFKVLFEQYGKVLSDKQIYTLIQKRKSPKIKALIVDGETIDAALVFDTLFNVVPETKKETTEKPEGASLF
jgi:DNA topoisomerase-3